MRVALTAFLAVASWSAPVAAGPLPFRCTAAVVVEDLRLLGTPGLALLDAHLDYPAADADVLGSGARARCQPGALVLESGAVSTFFDDDDGTVSLRYEGASGVPDIQFSVAICRLTSIRELFPDDFSVSLNDARFPDGSVPGFAVTVAVGDVTCAEGGTTTTSSSTTSSTTTTLPARCGDATGDGAVTASDCLVILRAAIGLDECLPACVCDTTGDGATSATDALLCLGEATGQSVELACPCD